MVMIGLWWATTRSFESEAAAPGSEQTESGPTQTQPTEQAPPSEPPPSEPPPPPSTPPQEAPPTTEFESDVELTDCPVGTSPENDAIICDLVHFVEDARGRPFQRYPTVELVENDAFDEQVLADFDQSVSELQTTGDVLRSLEIIDADADLVSLFRASLEVGVLGFYDPDSEELVVRGDNLDLFVQSVVVHELVHAHDDQWLDLNLSAFDDAEDESGFGYLSIVEGNATRIEDDWVDSLSSDDQTELRLLANSALSAEDFAVLSALPSFLLEIQSAPYIDGPVLVGEIEAAGGEDAVDEAFANPPRSSEQVLHPDALFGNDEPIAVPPVAFDGVEIDSGVFGELSIRGWLGRTAAEGWGGDRYVTFERGADLCTTLDVVMDSAAELGELESSANDWASAATDRTVERTVERTGDQVTITGCISR